MALTRRPVSNEPEPPSAYRKNLPCGRMYSNDFAALLRFLREDGRDVEVRAGQAAWLDGADDLVELRRQERSELRLTVANPRVEIALGGNSRAWTNQVDSEDAKRLVDGVESLCKSWRTWTGRFDLSPFASCAAICLGISAVIGVIWLVGDPKPSVWITGPAFAGPLWLITLLGTGHRIHVSPRSRHAANERRLQVFGTVAISLVSGAAGSVATWLLALRN